jgi:hypothetical protein
MSQLNRIVWVAIVLMAVVVVSVPAPAFAAPPAEGNHVQAGVWAQAWSWLVSVVDPVHGIPRVWEKEGGAIDPNGHTNPAVLPVPTPTVIRTNGGNR